MGFAGYVCQTSIVFALDEGPGALVKALGVFSLRQINITKVFAYISISVSMFIDCGLT